MNIQIPNALEPPLATSSAPSKLRDSRPSERLAQSVDSRSRKDDTVDLNTSTPQAFTYADPRLNNANKTNQTPDLETLLEESSRKAQEIINLILPLVEQQGLNLAKLVSGEQKLNVDPETIAAAKAAIDTDGEFGVQKTAERILTFAKAAIGNDPSKLDEVRAAVERGFKEAADFLGGSLPEISQKTLEVIQTEFDRLKTDGF
jgi:uncharacterized protein YdhG (YjbR/CyaY superfamily)